METVGKRGGFFASFEGPEGSGKSTQIHRLAASLAEQSHTVWTTREPGGTRAGEFEQRDALLDVPQAKLPEAARGKRAVEAVADPAVEAEPQGLPFGPYAKTYFLDDAPDRQPLDVVRSDRHEESLRRVVLGVLFCADAQRVRPPR